jgi:hypothetical protein
MHAAQAVRWSIEMKLPPNLKIGCHDLAIEVRQVFDLTAMPDDNSTAHFAVSITESGDRPDLPRTFLNVIYGTPH